MDIARVLEHVQYSILPHLCDVDKLQLMSTCKSLYNPTVVQGLRFDGLTKAAHCFARAALMCTPRTVVYTSDDEKQLVSICISGSCITVKSTMWCEKERRVSTTHLNVRGKSKAELAHDVHSVLNTTMHTAGFEPAMGYPIVS